MKCISVTVDDKGHTITNGITLPYRCAPNGVEAYLGYPYVERDEEGPQHRGRRCDRLGLDTRLLGDKVATLKQGDKGDVTIEACSVTEGAKGGIGLVPTNATCDGLALVLIRINKGGAECDSKPLAEGYLIDYGVVRGTRHPNRYVKREVEERLVKLRAGERFLFSTIEKEERILGFTVHRGRRRTFAITTDGVNVFIDEIVSKPLAVPVFDASHLVSDLLGALLCIGFGTMCGVVASNPRLDMTKYGIVGGALGLLFYAVIGVIRYIVHLRATPKYIEQRT